MNQEEFGLYLRTLRKGKKLTLVELAEASNVSNPYISQIENGKFKPSNDVLQKLAIPLGVSHFDLMVAAGYYTDEEIRQRKAQEDFYNSMTPEEEEAYIMKQLKGYKKHLNIKDYQEKMYTRLEDILKDERRSFYIDDHKLTNEEIKMLITLYGGKEKNYPSDEQIEKEYEEIKRMKEEVEEENMKNSDDPNSGFSFTLSGYHDIDTDEDV